MCIVCVGVCGGVCVCGCVWGMCVVCVWRCVVCVGDVCCGGVGMCVVCGGVCGVLKGHESFAHQLIP